MKNLMLIFFTLTVTHAWASTPIEKTVYIDNIYVPDGYDSNDNVEVMVEGALPNLCHKSPKVEVHKNGNEVNLKLTSLYYSAENYFCPPAIVPFLLTVNLGILNKGEYKITNGNLDGIKKDLKINEASTEDIDDFIYANVDYLEKVRSEKNLIRLKGYHVSDCFELDHVDFSTNKSDTVIVLPIMRQVSEFCPRKMMPFEYEVEVPSLVERGKILMHVRTMNGNSYNKLIEN